MNNPTTSVYAGTTYVVLSSENYAIIQEFAKLLDVFKELELNEFDDVFDYDTDEDFSVDSIKVDEILTELKEEQSRFSSAEKTAPQRDPLIIDLGEDDIDLTDIENGVYFDLDNNGFAEKTAWIGEEDGFLAIDVNKNDSIDNGSELFGDKFIMPDGNVSRTGSEALSSLDENGDGVINADDTLFESLCIWVDADHDGETDDGELLSLIEYGIESVDLNFTLDGTVNTETGAVTSLGEIGQGTQLTGLFMVPQPTPPEPEIINEIYLEGFTAPVWGEHPNYDMYVDDEAPYALTGLVWRYVYGMSDPEVLPEEYFDDDEKAYYLAAKFSPKPGYLIAEHPTVYYNGVDSIFDSGLIFGEDYWAFTIDFYVTKPVGVAEQIPESLSVWPNPTDNMLHLNVVDGTTVSIFDMTGRLVKQERYRGQLDVSNLIPGIYAIKAEGCTIRFVKE